NNGNGSNNVSGNNNNSTNNSIRKVLSGNEKNGSKILIRAISGLTLIVFFLICIYLGHLYVCLLVALSEILLFRELVKVRYNTYFESRIQDTIPLFRTTQWMWFVIAIFYTYSEFIMQVIDNNPNLYYLIKYTNPYLYIIIFTLYSCTFVITIVTLKIGHIKFQLNQLCWTIVVLCLTVGQMKYIMHNIFNGLFWFTFPFLCVVCNDVMAYFCGISCGRKFIQRKFMSVSPNKTWEGFIGGGICTMIFAWYFSKFLAQYSWMVCPVNDFELFPSTLTCDQDGSIHPIFQQGTIKPPLLQQDYELIPWEQIYPIQIHALWLGFFASVVGPFGGFLASAIKRAYGIKDFDSIIPGHGGITDRLDCQFLMALCTWVHYNSFV
ncbi:phosphatidate cytidylyltransferase, partial [Fragilariopsis cylindrus CCMP1102]